MASDAVWNTRYSTGIQLIDEQHKELFAVVNELRRAVQAGADRAEIRTLISKLLKCSEEHFATEEAYMSRYGYPDLTQHVAEHISMVTSLRELSDKFDESHHTMALMVPTFMEGWLRHHISDGDFGFVTFLKSRGLV